MAIFGGALLASGAAAFHADPLWLRAQPALSGVLALADLCLSELAAALPGLRCDTPVAVTPLTSMAPVWGAAPEARGRGVPSKKLRYQNFGDTTCVSGARRGAVADLAACVKKKSDSLATPETARRAIFDWAMSGESALEVDGTLSDAGDVFFEVRSGALELHAGFVSGAVLGALCAIAFLVLAVAALPVLSRQQHEAGLWFTAAPRQERLDLRAEWMDEHLAQAFEDKSMLEDDAWQDYRVIHLRDVGKQLICPPTWGPVKMGFAAPGRGGLKTIMPWDEEVAFDILTVCETRI